MKIPEIQLLTNELFKQKDFYTNTLNLPLVSETADSFTVKAGVSEITFKQNNTLAKPYYHLAFNVPENKIDESSVWLKDKAEQAAYENSLIVDFKNWNAHSTYFYDPAGNILEFIARHNLKNAAVENNFNSKMILGISEIGLPVESVNKFCNFCDESLGEKLWSGNNETFAAIGDEEGLFIAVPANRNWFPTEKPSEKFPLAVKIESLKNPGKIIEYENYTIITK